MITFIYGDDPYQVKKSSKPFLKDAEVYEYIPDNLSELTRSQGLFTTNLVLRLTDLKGLELSNIYSDIAIVFNGLPDKRLKVTKALLLKAKCQSFLLPKSYNTQALSKLVRMIASDIGITKIDNTTVEKLATFYGTDTLRIASELSKSFNAFGATITVEHIEIEDCSTVIFNLAGYILKRDVKSALRCVSTLALQGEHPVKVLSILTRQFKDSLDVSLGFTTGIPAWKLKQLQCNRSSSDLNTLTTKTLGALTNIKTGIQFDLKTWVIQVCMI